MISQKEKLKILLNYSDPLIVQRLAKKIYNLPIYLSTKKDKKYFLLYKKAPALSRRGLVAFPGAIYGKIIFLFFFKVRPFPPDDFFVGIPQGQTFLLFDL